MTELLVVDPGKWGGVGLILFMLPFFMQLILIVLSNCTVFKIFNQSKPKIICFLCKKM